MQWNEFRSHIGYLSARQQQRVREAFELGKKMHAGQKRYSGEPYFSHPIAVANMLADMHADGDTIVAALLHDTVEDTPLTLREIETAFNGNVSGLIEGVTKLSAADVADQPNVNEQIETLRKIFTLMEKDVRIMVIKLVDRLHNMQTAEFLPKERQHALAQETLDVYVKIADRLCLQDIRDELEGLALAILEPELFARLSDLRMQNELCGEAIMKTLRQKIGDANPQALKNLLAEFEVKTWDKRREQLRMEGTTVTGIAAITIVFVCKDVDACYQTLGLLHQIWKREVMSFQDFINTPAMNGYRGLHTTILLEDGTRVRCKIRTAELHAYARKGITLECFKGKGFSLLDSLPWAERISSLAQDTEGRSGKFWQSLQSDILGESIVIYGPADQSVIIPKGSTALDGAFHVFKEDAFRTSSISIDGKSVHFTALLQHSASLNVTLSEHPTVERTWLEWTKTGFATAMIRSALTHGKSEREKISLGQELLQRTLSERHKGFIEELGKNPLQLALVSLGYPSLDSLYVAVANGQLDPLEAYRTLFERHRKTTSTERHSFQLSYDVDTANTETMDRIGMIHRTYREGISDIHYQRHPDPRHGKVRLRGALSDGDRESLVAEISAAGGENIRSISFFSRLNILVGIGVLVMLWGLDPVFARMLLTSDIQPVDLTVIRFLTVWIIAAILFAGQYLLSRLQLKQLNPFNADLMLCAVALFVTGFSTYLTLVHIFPTQYILFIIAGVLIGALVRHRTTWHSLPSLLITVAALVILSVLQGWSGTGFLFAAISSAGFALYSALSKRYQEEKAFIRTRYPAFIFWVGTGSLLLSGLLLPYSHLQELSAGTIGRALLFSAILITLPYVLYFECMRRMNAVLLDRMLPFVCVSTILGETIMTKSHMPLIALALPLVFAIFLSNILKKSLVER